jgi:hypothetical protein
MNAGSTRVPYETWLRVLPVAKPGGGWILAACRVVRPGGHDRIPVDPPRSNDLEAGKKVVQPVGLPWHENTPKR